MNREKLSGALEPVFSTHSIHALARAFQEATRESAACVDTVHVMTCLRCDTEAISFQIADSISPLLFNSSDAVMHPDTRPRDLSIDSLNGLPLSLACKFALGLAYEEAITQGCKYVHSGHCLLAFILVGNNTFERLRDLGLKAEDLVEGLRMQTANLFSDEKVHVCSEVEEVTNRYHKPISKDSYESRISEWLVNAMNAPRDFELAATMLASMDPDE